MATEQMLARIHVFPSESSFNENKDSVGANEISLVKTTNLAVPGYVSANGAKLQPITFKKMTLLTSGTPQGSGDIELSQPYTNFDGLYFVFGNNSDDYYNYNFIPTAELTRMIGLAKSWGTNKYITLTNSFYYWAINASTTTTTTLKIGHENSYFRACYGVTI